MLLLAVAAAVLAPNLPLADPDIVDTPNRLRPPLTDGHPLGTDEFGRDLLSRLVWGARVSLLAGVGTAALAMLVGVLLGVLGGYYTGWVEAIVMRLTDVLMAFPYILLAIAIVAGLGPSLRNAMVATAIVGFPLYTRLVRGVVLSVKQLEFVEAAAPRFSPPQDSRSSALARNRRRRIGGSMLATGRQFVILSPHVVLLPGLAIFVIVFAVNLVGDALRDALDPRSS